ncbi:MAG: GNAT family N-acetyltransferase [Bacteroidales bacterium]|nr:GNAT family N-acetyltransferase [Bacteroidales bacterium]
MEIKSLEHTDFDTLFRGFDDAFSDYGIRFEKEEVHSMLKRRGYNPELSFAAFDNGEIVAFTLNGTGIFNGIPTAYDTGTGTIKRYRGQGLAGKIFTHSIPFLQNADVRQYLLEVMQDNQKAISLYSRMNFRVTRGFDCFRQAIDKIDNLNGNTECMVRQVGVDSIRHAQECCDFSPSWQNSIDSIERGASDLICIGAFLRREMVGYCVLDACTGDLAQMAVQRKYRRKGIASRLLQEALGRMKTDFVKILNVSSGSFAMHAFLENKNIPLASRQLEMLLPL